MRTVERGTRKGPGVPLLHVGPGAAELVQEARRIAIVGCGGAGKSWLAVRLGDRLGLPIHRLDEHYYDASWNSVGDWPERQRTLAAADDWIMDGTYVSTLDSRLDRAEVVVLMDLPTRTCLRAVVLRRLRHRGPTRPDRLGAERITVGFLSYVVRFRRVARDRMLAAIATHRRQVPVVLVRSRHDARSLASAVTRLAREC